MTVFVATAPTSNQTLTGLLQTGEYELSVLSELGDTAVLTTNEFANSSYSLSFQLTPTPEPARLTLLGLGLAGFVAWGRGKSRNEGQLGMSKALRL
jgi:hypothetical protein